MGIRNLMEQSFTPKKYFDALSNFSAGMNSGVAPTLLPKNQLAWMVNGSLRGGYVTHRPPFNRLAVSYESPDVKTAVEGGFFQGSGFYLADSGAASLIAQYSGRLFQFSLSSLTVHVSEISIAGDLGDAAAKQVWMWQSEKWMIISDGTGSLPIFFDGTSCRRSNGPSKILTTTAADFAAPTVIGQQVAVTLSSVFKGVYGIPVIVDGDFYNTQPTSTPNLLNITNISATPGLTVLSGDSIYITPKFYRTVSLVTAYGSSGAVSFNDFTGLKIGDKVHIPAGTVDITNRYGLPTRTYTNTEFVISSIDLSKQQSFITCTTSFPMGQGDDAHLKIPNNSDCTIETTGGTVSLFAVVGEDFTTPAAGDTLQIKTQSPYDTSATGTLLIDGGEYTFEAVASGSGSGNEIILVNLNNVATKTVASGTAIRTIPELPASRNGAYGMGCNCCCGADAVSYIVGDVVGSSSGTAQFNYRDAVLRVTQNDFLLGGGAFRIPSSGNQITSITFPAVLDTSLGQGPLQVGTQSRMFSNSTPGTDPSGWPTLTTPIQSVSLKGAGPCGQNNTTEANSDTIFRSPVGIGSLVIARRDFSGNYPGNKCISNEVVKILRDDDLALLQYGSGQFFDNRLSMTASPVSTGYGVFHRAFVSLNYDLLSSLRESNPASWEGMWTGLNAGQVVAGAVSGTLRSFVFTRNFSTSTNELYELLPENTSSYQDNDETPIVWAFETPVLFNGDIKPVSELAQLRDGEIYVSDVRGTVTIQAFYKPDFYPGWVEWNTVTLQQASDATNSQVGYRMRVGLGEPSSKPVEAGNNRPLRTGYFFQFRFVISGHCVFKSFMASAISLPIPTFAPVKSDNSAQIIDVNTPDDLTLYTLQGNI